MFERSELRRLRQNNYNLLVSVAQVESFFGFFLVGTRKKLQGTGLQKPRKKIFARPKKVDIQIIIKKN